MGLGNICCLDIRYIAGGPTGFSIVYDSHLGNTYLISLQKEIMSDDRISDDKLFELYKISIDTDRFELELG
jgi:hypothetical protein